MKYKAMTPLQKALLYLFSLTRRYAYPSLRFGEQEHSKFVQAFLEVERLYAMQQEQEQAARATAEAQAQRVRIEAEALRKAIEKGTLA